MDSLMTVNGFVGLYIFMLAAFAGWVIIGNVPAILHTPLMSGSNFVHGIVVVGGMFALLNATSGDKPHAPRRHRARAHHPKKA
jgi:NAD(P) transhydrogenase subunit alpha